ncbi:hypothetical protein PENTCL1PPCAC_17910, partial [Pristionchus entomophagus]
MEDQRIGHKKLPFARQKEWTRAPPGSMRSTTLDSSNQVAFLGPKGLSVRSVLDLLSGHGRDHLAAALEEAISSAVAPSPLVQYSRQEAARRKFARSLSLDPSLSHSLLPFLLSKVLAGASKSTLALIRSSFLFFGGELVSPDIPVDLSSSLIRSVG